MKVVRRVVFSILIVLALAANVLAQDTNTKTKFYNFDDLLIKGKIKKPQVLFIDKRQKVQFEKLLKLKKEFLNKLHDTRKDHSLR